MNDIKGFETGVSESHHVTAIYRSLPGTGVLWRQTGERVHGWSSAGILKTSQSNDLHLPGPELEARPAASSRPPPLFQASISQLRTAQAFQNARFRCPRFGRSQGRRRRLQTRSDSDENIHRPYGFAESGLCPGALPQGAKGIQAHPRQGLRCRWPGRHI